MQKKRIIYKEIENKKGKTYTDYAHEFEYLTNSGVALQVQAVSNPHFPLIESQNKTLIKLYLNDVGILTALLYKYNVIPVLQNIKSINLGTVYESVVAQELSARGYSLHYYDNKQKGEIDFLIDDYNSLSVLPIEIKSGKDYKQYSALSKFLTTPDYGIKKGIVFSNERIISEKDHVLYLPIYFIMFFNNKSPDIDYTLPELID